MKKILLTLILALVANTVMADWSLVDESADDSVTIYTDFDTIQKTEDKVKMWSLGDTVLELRGKLASIKQVGRDDNGLLVE